MSRSHSSTAQDENTENYPAPAKPAPSPAANPQSVEERLTRIEGQLATLMPRIEALTGPL